MDRGQRIARARCRRGLSQAALAGLVGRSESWLSQVERGVREIDSHAVLTALAGVLRVDVADLTGEQAPDPRPSRYAAARDIERAMMAYDSLESVIGADSPAREPNLASLQFAVDRVNRTYQTACYDEAGRLLAGLIRAVETAARTCPAERSTEVLRVRSEVYQATAARRASGAAAPIGPRRAAPGRCARRGAWLRRRSGRSLGAAWQVAERVGQDRNDCWTAFGPTNVRIHEISAAVALGDAARAVEVGESLNLDQLPSGLTGRRSQVSLTLARATTCSICCSGANIVPARRS